MNYVDLSCDKCPSLFSFNNIVYYGMSDFVNRGQLYVLVICCLINHRWQGVIAISLFVFLTVNRPI